MSEPVLKAAVPPRTRRRVWRWVLSLRGLMVLVLVIGGGLGWWVRQARTQREALEIIEATGSPVVYGDDEPNLAGWRTWVYERTGLALFREVAKVEIDDGTQNRIPFTFDPLTRAQVCAAVGRLGRVGLVSFYEGTVTPANLAELRRADVHGLNIQDIATISPAALDEIGRMRSLRWLLIGTLPGKLPIAALQTAAALPDLEVVALAGLPPVTRADLAPLAGLTQLKTLRIAAAPVDPAYLDDLLVHPGLTTLELAATQVTDAHLRRLVAALPHLTAIVLDGSRLTDAGIEAVGTLPDLESLDLRGSMAGPSAVTDRSLQAIGRCRQLKSLTLPHGRFTAAGLDALQGLPLWKLDLGAVESIHPSRLARAPSGPPWLMLGLHGPGINDATLPGLAAVVGPGTHLDLSGSALTDAGVATLAPVRLRELNLADTALTDAGLAALAQGTTARLVYVANTRVTAAGVAAFRAARPRTTLNGGPIQNDQ